MPIFSETSTEPIIFTPMLDTFMLDDGDAVMLDTFITLDDGDAIMLDTFMLDDGDAIMLTPNSAQHVAWLCCKTLLCAMVFRKQSTCCHAGQYSVTALFHLYLDGLWLCSHHNPCG